MEKTLSIIKPDACQNGHIGDIISMYERKGLKIENMRMEYLTREKAEAFYAEHKGQEFYERLIKFMISGPCIPMIITGRNAIADVRKINGNTNPHKAEKGTIRNLFGGGSPNNAVHGSDSESSAIREINFFFGWRYSGKMVPKN